MNSPPPKPEVILTNFFAEPTVLLVPITNREYTWSNFPLVKSDIGYITMNALCTWFQQTKKNHSLFALKLLLHCVQNYENMITQGRIQDFKLGGAHLKKLRRAEGGAKTFGVFRVKNHDYTPKNHIFSNCGGRREKRVKILIFSKYRGNARWVTLPPLDSPQESFPGRVRTINIKWKTNIPHC